MIMPTEQVERIVDHTVAVLTTHGNRRAEWRDIVAEAASVARDGGPPWQPEAEFFEAILSLLDSSSLAEGTEGGLPTGHPYAEAWAAIEAGAAHFDAGPGLSDEQVEFVVHRTAEVLTTDPDGRAEWQDALSGALAEARELKRAEDAEFFEALLEMLDASPGTAAARGGLPADHNYAAALAMVGAIVEAGGPGPTAVTPETMRIVRDFVSADGWGATRQIVEAHADVLLSPQVDNLFTTNIVALRAQGDEESARLLEEHQIVLRACRERGIAAVFDLLQSLE